MTPIERFVFYLTVFVFWVFMLSPDELIMRVAGSMYANNEQEFWGQYEETKEREDAGEY